MKYIDGGKKASVPSIDKRDSMKEKRNKGMDLTNLKNQFKYF